MRFYIASGKKSVSIHLIPSEYTALRLQLEIQSNIFYVDSFILFFSSTHLTLAPQCSSPYSSSIVRLQEIENLTEKLHNQL